ncbi:ATP-binding cassette domain-containing protein [Marinobacter sp. M3C]|jgi:ATP-binding cassette subfamily F protein 3|uniref:ATP-binding cassette domain-containing protein n=1 Tax=unclassified Marinobacter TaxID=83889 RepID=UPI00200EA13B|nr:MULTISPECIES: ATP-binding cassette domain-containing protein [unclassified Marinobacter]MCL1478539.1 ATP-binding cassette domain-containing protein [Marinobacter sp.]UQG56613.1 ATP-binding cassette domain-containing protein [Marinobacter sp. M4C]UQG62176.1 ATP-binding cassette domain-containing protein [Marinobacter sp. M3C]UQG65417.1 ATP-binding cassette domain-containing protein [Marinobacter sp. M2C]UQG69697.1 ATP-binding cassette domain-containing protein [Marinobacter sp. M1C]
MLTISDLSLQRGGAWLLEGVSLTVQPGQRMAIVGANGAGKSSLFQLILGDLAPEQGHFSLPGGCRIAHMAQEVEATGRSARDFVLDGDFDLRRLEHELARAEAAQDDLAQARVHGELDLHEAWSASRRAESLLRGLGFGDGDADHPVSSFSGGWRIRLNLAQALMRPSDLMLLDEPTNHLDLDACLWLENWLRRYSGTLLFISHDRDFMDRVATHVVHFDRRDLALYSGNYSAFEVQRSERLAQQQAGFERQQARIAEIQRFIDRFKAQATKARQAQSRVKSLERMEKIAPAHIDSPFNFQFPLAEKVSNPLLSIRQGQAGHGDVTILRNLNLSLLPGSRIGLLGPNGAGKSTLMDSLRGEATLINGERTCGEHLAIGYFAQHQLESLDLDASPFLHLQRLSPRASDQSIRNFLGGFDFHGNAALSPIRSFSGGEKARVALAVIAWQRPNLLLLDEPTNHLDLEMRQALTMALQNFDGAIVVVSHDRHLLRNTVDEFWLVNDGRVVEYEGDLEDYERWLADRRKDDTEAPKRQSAAAEGGQDAAVNGESADDRKARKRAEAAVRQKISPFRKQQATLEKQMDSMQAALAEMDAELTNPTLYGDSGKQQLKTLLGRQAEARQKMAVVESQWLDVSETVEVLEAELES